MLVCEQALHNSYKTNPIHILFVQTVSENSPRIVKIT